MSYAEPNNVTSIADIFSYANNVSDNIFGIGSLIVLFLIISLYLHNNRGEDFMESMVVGGFLTSVAGVMFFLLGLITNWHLFVIILIFAVTTIVVYANRSG